MSRIKELKRQLEAVSEAIEVLDVEEPNARTAGRGRSGPS